MRGIVNQIEVHVASEHTDPNIATAAVEALARNSQVPRDHVTVKVTDGWVTLKGEVDHDYQRRAAERTVRDLHGVRGVANLITIKSMVQAGDVKDEIERSFERQALIDAGNVAVVVSGSSVTLRGMVRSWAERREAQNAAAATPGVTSVENQLVVRS
jgi:osmotically-inducible protein OsmY